MSKSGPICISSHSDPEILSCWSQRIEIKRGQLRGTSVFACSTATSISVRSEFNFHVECRQLGRWFAINWRVAAGIDIDPSKCAITASYAYVKSSPAENSGICKLR